MPLLIVRIRSTAPSSRRVGVIDDGPGRMFSGNQVGRGGADGDQDVALALDGDRVGSRGGTRGLSQAGLATTPKPPGWPGRRCAISRDLGADRPLLRASGRRSPAGGASTGDHRRY